MAMSIMGNSSSTHGKILIIEDEPDIKDILKLQLEQAGYHIIEATNGEEGIEIMKKRSNLLQVGLVITDICMPNFNGVRPKINGVELIEYIIANAPSISAFLRA